jgi:uncharacterized protein (DUF1697 family)
VTVYVVLLRGVNVGGVKLPMADLRRIAESCGFIDPRTYIQSGNLIFAAARTSQEKIAAELRTALAEDLGLDIPMMVRSHAQLRAAVEANPFVKDGLDPNQQSVSFFAEDVPADILADVDLEQYSPEALRVHQREIYFNLPLGTGRSPMLKDLGRRKALTIGTMRNWRTTTTLLSMADELTPPSS